MDFGEKFSSAARMLLEVLRLAVCLMSDNTVYSTSIADSVFGN